MAKEKTPAQLEAHAHKLAGDIKECLGKTWVKKSEAYKAEDGRWYVSQNAYEEHKRKTKNRYDLIDYVCREFLDYDEGQPFSTFLPRKLQTLDYYDDALILQVFKDQTERIHYALEHNQFNNELNKISYMIGIVRNALPEALQKQKREVRQEQLAASRIRADGPIEVQQPVERKVKDISCWLEDDE